MGSALLNTEATDSSLDPSAAGSSAAGARAADLRLEVAERLAAHRNRRPHAPAAPAPAARPTPAAARSARIAAAVAERYARTQTYRAYLAEEAERAVQQARAAAEIAARNAQALAAAQQSLLQSFDQASFDQISLDHDPLDHDHAAEELPPDLSPAAPPEPRTAELASPPAELNLWPDLDPIETTLPAAHKRHAVVPGDTPRNGQRTTNNGQLAPPESHPQASHPGTFTVRLYEDARSAAHVSLAPRAPAVGHANREPDRNDIDARALDEEIAFRQSPVFEEPAGPPVPLPANLIEFPRQLVASRKARPRLAEGPLRDEAPAAPLDGQLRIFEVDPAQISTTPADAEPSGPAAPQWTSLWLDAPASAAQPAAPPFASAAADREPQPQFEPRTAPLPISYADAAGLGRRLFAAAVNAAIVLTGLAAAAAVFTLVAGHVALWQRGLPLPAELARIAAQAGAATGIQLRQLPAALAIAAACLALLYQALFFTFSTATPGMRSARIALCTFDDENPTRRLMRRRILAAVLSACPLGLGFLWAALDEDRLAWHDRLTRTYQRRY